VRTALVIAVPEAEPAVGALRVRYDDADRTGIPAHVTLVVPFGDRDDGLAELFAGCASFEFALTEVRRWPDVLWLAPEPAEPFVELVEAIVARYPEHPLYGGAHGEVIPHLTVGSRRPVPAGADAELAARLPIRATATQVVQLEEHRPNRWRERRRFALGRPRT
jgi:2'-5' RNA ligase superfamily protein